MNQFLRAAPQGSFEPTAPDFLCIGAPRSGTTWLFRVLQAHPDVWLPPVKEMHYFDSVDPTLGEKFATHKRSYRFQKHFLSRSKHYLALPLRLRAKYSSRIQPDLYWDLRYFLGSGSLEWYWSLFLPARKRGKLTGEITPAYSMISEQMIKIVYALNPNMKIIYLLRDPLDRVWSSAARYLLKRRLTPGSVDAERFLLERIHSDGSRRRSMYLANVDRWQAVFGADRLLIGFFEELRTDQAGLIRRVCDFLEIEDLSSPFAVRFSAPVNAATHQIGRIPSDIEYKLACIYEPELRELKERFPGAPAEWHRRAKEVIGSGKKSK